MAEFFDEAVRKPLLAHVPSWIHPNHLTVARAAFLVPLVLVRNSPFWAISVVTLSSLCDLLDGPLARNRGQVSQDGATLDATCDKVFNLGAILFACWGLIPYGIAIAVIALDLVLAGIRPVKRRRGIKTDANAYGGAKVWLQSLGIGFALYRAAWSDMLVVPLFGLAIVAAVLSLAGHIRDFAR